MNERSINREEICRMAGIPTYWARKQFLERPSKTFDRQKKVDAIKKMFADVESGAKFGVESNRENLKNVGLV